MSDNNITMVFEAVGESDIGIGYSCSFFFLLEKSLLSID